MRENNVVVTHQPLYDLLLSCNSLIYFLFLYKLRDCLFFYETTNNIRVVWYIISRWCGDTWDDQCIAHMILLILVPFNIIGQVVPTCPTTWYNPWLWVCYMPNILLWPLFIRRQKSNLGDFLNLVPFTFHGAAAPPWAAVPTGHG